MNVLTRTTVSTMRLETKYLRLRTPVTLGSRFGDWEVTWLGGWTRDRLSYLVMAVGVASEENDQQKSFTTVGSDRSFTLPGRTRNHQDRGDNPGGNHRRTGDGDLRVSSNKR